MARKPRLHVPGGLYHVILRGNARQDVFLTAGDRQVFYDLLAEGVVRFGYRVHAFCLMTNHLHLALQAGESGKSEGPPALYYGGKDDSRVVGEEDFVRTVLPRKVTGRKPVSLAAIVAQVCRSARMSEAGKLLALGKARTPAHGLAGWRSKPIVRP